MKTLLSIIRNYLEEHTEDLVGIVSEVNLCDGDLEHLLYYDMEEFNEKLSTMKPWDIVRAAHFGEFNPTDDYFKWDGYGNLESVDDYEYKKELENSIKEIADKVKELMYVLSLPDGLQEAIDDYKEQSEYISSCRELYTDLREKQQKEVNDFPIKFAFNDKQFIAAMEELGLTPSDTDKITNTSVGGFVRKTDKQAFIDMNKRHKAELSFAMQSEEFAYGAFSEELANHEYICTYEYDDALRALGLTFVQVKENDILNNALNKALQEYEED